MPDTRAEDVTAERPELPPQWACTRQQLIDAIMVNRVITRNAAERLADAILSQLPEADDMFETAYMDVQRVLDDALGTEELDGAGGGIAADVALLADRCKAAEAEVARLSRLAEAAGLVSAP